MTFHNKIVRGNKSCAPAQLRLGQSLHTVFALVRSQMMAARPGSEMTWSVLPEERDSSDEAVHNAGFLDGTVSNGADGWHMRREAAEERNIRPGHQLSIVTKAREPLLLQVCCNKQVERDSRARRTSTGDQLARPGTGSVVTCALPHAGETQTITPRLGPLAACPKWHGGTSAAAHHCFYMAKGSSRATRSRQPLCQE